MKRFFAWLGSEYGYTPRQSAQLLGLLCLALAFLSVPLLYKAWLVRQPPGPVPALEIVSLADSGAEADSYPRHNDADEVSNTSLPSAGLHDFDPNAATEDEWQSLGAPAWLGRRIVHYRQAGGVFHKAEDVGKIYDFPENLLDRLTPYMRFSDKPVANQKEINRYTHSDREANYPRKEYTAPSYPVLDLNTADSASLEALPQIGPAIAHSILGYRRILGGFVSPQQLYELYNQDSARTAVFLPYLKASAADVHKINVNDLSRARKLYHPYLPKDKARLISAYVKEHGNLARPEQLLEHKLLDSASYRKLLPYLEIP